MATPEHGLDWTPYELWARTDNDVMIRLQPLTVERGWHCRKGYNPNECRMLWPDHEGAGCGPIQFIQVPFREGVT